MRDHLKTDIYVCVCVYFLLALDPYFLQVHQLFSPLQMNKTHQDK